MDVERWYKVNMLASQHLHRTDPWSQESDRARSRPCFILHDWGPAYVKYQSRQLIIRTRDRNVASVGRSSIAFLLQLASGDPSDP